MASLLFLFVCSILLSLGTSDGIVNQVPATLKSPKTGDIHPLTTKKPTTTPEPTTRDVNATTVLTTPKTTKSPYSEICYKVVGCFNDRPPFSINQLPNSPQQVGTIFSLFRFNTTEEFLDYTNKTSVSNSSYDYTLPTKFIVHGFAQNGKAGWVRKMKDEFLKIEDMNVLIVDWKNGASFPDYGGAVGNTRLVAAQIFVIIQQMTTLGANLDDMHLIGHSLGAHASGYTGRRFAGKLGRISGLDPAGPSYKGHNIAGRLDSTDAQFVDVTHTNGEPVASGGAAMYDASGNVDFYVNGGKQQPGCPSILTAILHGKSPIDAAACSHSRSHDIYVESINSRCPFTGFNCGNYTSFQKGLCFDCQHGGCSQMGYHSDKFKARGSLYLNTRKIAPYCGYTFYVSLQAAANSTSTRGKIKMRFNGEHGSSGWAELTKYPYSFLFECYSL